MPQILIAHPAASPRWKVKTICYVFPDNHDMHSFPAPLYEVIQAKGTVEEIEAKLQACAGVVIDISSGKTCPNEWRKNLSAVALTPADKATLESKTADTTAVFTKLTSIASIPVEDIKVEENPVEPKPTDEIVNKILNGG